MYTLFFSTKAEEDLKYFKKRNNLDILSKIKKLLDVISETPTQGIGKPEMLKHHLSGSWSRRIDFQHRLIYRISELQKEILIVSCKGHYF